MLSSECRSPSEGSVVELYARSLLRNRANGYDANLVPSGVHVRFYLHMAAVDAGERLPDC